MGSAHKSASNGLKWSHRAPKLFYEGISEGKLGSCFWIQLFSQPEGDDFLRELCASFFTSDR